MRGPAPIEVVSTRHSVWRCFVFAMAGAAVAAQVAWVWSVVDQRSAVSIGAATGFALLGVALALSAASPPTVRLRWNGSTWQLGGAVGTSDETVDGHVRIALDLGGWMLLRFVALPADGGRRTWLPVQRSGLDGDWHALRCAVHARQGAPDAAL